MKISKKSLIIIRLFFLVLVYINIFMAGKDSKFIWAFIFSLSVCNDLYRKQIKNSEGPKVNWRKNTIISMIISIFISAMLKIFVGVYLYMYICLVDLLFYNKKKFPSLLLVFYGVCFLASDAVLLMQVKDKSFAWTSLGNNMLYFFAGLLICILILEQVKQKEKFEQLGCELQEKNDLLEQQQQLKEELALSKERELIAQELHDSIGHTLVAVKMYVKVLEKYFTANNSKESEIFNTLNEVIQEGMSQLRKTVYHLKENTQCINLKDALEQLIQSVMNTQGPQIYLLYDEKIDTIELHLKEDMYKSIRECITNSLKYANAAHIWVTLQTTDKEVMFGVKDDGEGVNVINKSHGILGIEERIKKWDGVCTVLSGENKGFSLQVRINIEEKKGR